MITKILKILAIVFTITWIVVSCIHSQENKNSVAANTDTIKQDTMKKGVSGVPPDITGNEAKFIEKEEELIRENNRKIAELKQSVKNDKKAVSNDYDEQLNKLNREDSVLQANIKEYEQKGKEDWQSFKYNINKEIDSIGKSISRLAERNMSKDK